MSTMEAGLPIMRSTGCLVGAHMWLHAGRSGPYPFVVHKYDRCLCGLMSWDERCKAVAASLLPDTPEVDYEQVRRDREDGGYEDGPGD
jgi:hypothetical protein